ncbi:hypothetical protein [Kineococcus vitellinus]|uniref:hypothetical protein n=1 Tax=Kineococcus vitellinus TaxID=2696565 RepID=UPI003B831400
MAYEIDLNENHAAAIEKSFHDWIETAPPHQHRSQRRQEHEHLTQKRYRRRARHRS